MVKPAEASVDSNRVRAVAGARVLGVDAARALAILGMVMVHFGPTGASAPGFFGRVYSSPHGRASILFALLAGVGVTLMAGDRSPTRRRGVWARLAWRAALLLPAGLALQLLDHGVLVILQYYAVYFLVAAAAVARSDRFLLGGSLAAAVAAPVVYLAAWHWQPAWFEVDPTVLTDPPVVIARNLVLAGAYPVVTWAAPLLFGLWLGRRDLRSPLVRRRMMAGGAVVAVAAVAFSKALEGWFGAPATEPSWALLMIDDPHSQMPLWLLSATGSAIAVLGATLVVVDRLPRASWPLVAAGQLALTVYVAHLVLLHGWGELVTRDEVGEAVLTVSAFALAVGLAAVAWRAAFERGPLESVLRLPWVVAAADRRRPRRR